MPLAPLTTDEQTLVRNALAMNAQLGSLLQDSANLSTNHEILSSVQKIQQVSQRILDNPASMSLYQITNEFESQYTYIQTQMATLETKTLNEGQTFYQKLLTPPTAPDAATTLANFTSTNPDSVASVASVYFSQMQAMFPGLTLAPDFSNLLSMDAATLNQLKTFIDTDLRNETSFERTRQSWVDQFSRISGILKSMIDSLKQMTKTITSNF